MTPITIDFALIGQGLILAGIFWLGRTTLKTRESIVRVEVILTGDDKGNSGLVSEVSGLRAKNHTLANAVQSLVGRQELLEHRVGVIEERIA